MSNESIEIGYGGKARKKREWMRFPKPAVNERGLWRSGRREWMWKGEEERSGSKATMGGAEESWQLLRSCMNGQGTPSRREPLGAADGEMAIGPPTALAPKLRAASGTKRASRSSHRGQDRAARSGNRTRPHCLAGWLQMAPDCCSATLGTDANSSSYEAPHLDSSAPHLRRSAPTAFTLRHDIGRSARNADCPALS
ncbi:hypothetical protein L1887_57004 [Cichorium endivia]|nr:hypothetical protein L1887_57004 [Cichorium endivia]